MQCPPQGRRIVTDMPQLQKRKGTPSPEQTPECLGSPGEGIEVVAQSERAFDVSLDVKVVVNICLRKCEVARWRHHFTQGITVLEDNRELGFISKFSFPDGAIPQANGEISRIVPFQEGLQNGQALYRRWITAAIVRGHKIPSPATIQISRTSCVHDGSPLAGFHARFPCRFAAQPLF